MPKTEDYMFYYKSHCPIALINGASFTSEKGDESGKRSSDR